MATHDHAARDVRRTLLLSRKTVAALATPADYLAAATQAFIDQAAKRHELPEVGHIPAAAGTFHIKTARRVGARPLVVLKVNGNFPDNPSRHALPTIQGFIALLDADRGQVLALMDSIEVTARRTAAATVLAARHLARSGSAATGFVGCGLQARYHLDALLDAFEIRVIRFCDPCDEAAASFAAAARARGVEAHRVPDPRAAASGADIVVTLTTSRHPVLRLADVAPGAFVAGVGADNPSKHELAPDLLRASSVVADLLVQAMVMGDLHHAIRCGAMRASDVHGELAEIVAGRIAGRVSDHQRFVFDSTGVAVLDLAAAEMLYQRACHADEVPAIVLNDAD